MEPQGGCNQIDQRRFVADLAFTEQPGGADVAAAAMRFDAPPVVDSLKDVFAIFVDLQFDYCQPAIVTQREEIDGAGAGRSAVRGAKLGMQRSDDQTRIEF